jgi:negative regulator of flagellin synthesis FlgM
VKIGGESVILELNKYLKGVDEKPKSSSKAPEKEGSNSPGDRVELSPRSQETRRVREAIDEVPDVDEAKVAEIKARIESGAYNVKGEEIAESIIEEAIVDVLL